MTIEMAVTLVLAIGSIIAIPAYFRYVELEYHR